jgi:transglutaminase-like putative cysteine protease
MTLAQFDGTKWFNESARAEPIPIENKRARLAPLDQLSQPGRRLQYEVQLKSPAGDALFFAGLPEQISIDAPRILRTAAGSFRTEGFSPPMRYAASSFLESPDHPVHDRDLAPGWRGVYLQLPPIDPRVAQLAQRLTARETSDEGRGLALERYLQTAFAYTTELPTQTTPDPIAHFLFERRKGHCEYFASAMALMLRTLGIPSRLATGFQSGLYNPVSDWYLIRASDAHSWVEAWIPNRGWVTFDPTPPDLRPPDTGLLARAALYLDALEVFWQDWVMSYDLERQILLADRVSRGGWNLNWSWSAAADSARRAWRRYAVPSGPWILAAFLLGQAVYWLLLPLLPRAWRAWKRRREEARIRSGAAHSADAALLYQRMLDALKQHGVEKPAWMTPREFTRTLGDLPARLHAERATDAYHEWRHAARPDAAPRMLDALADLEESLRR